MTPARIIAVGEELPVMGDTKPPRRQDIKNDKGSKTSKPKKKTGSRFSMLNCFIDFTMGGLKPAERAVWLVLFRDTKQNGIAKTSEKDIGRRAGITDRMVRYALQTLEKRGLVKIVHRGRLNHGPSSYRVFGVDKP